MTVVSLRCHECDEVKPEEEVEIGPNGNTCDDCRNDVPEVPEEDESANSDESAVSEQSEVVSEDSPAEDSDTPISGGESTEDAEEDKKPVEESFNEQDPLEW